MNSDATRLITFKDITTAWEIAGSDWLKARYDRLNLTYLELSTDERDEAILKVLDTLDGPLIEVGPHRNQDWERGWGENLSLYTKGDSDDAIIPRYFNKISLIRWMQKWIKPTNPKMEYEILGLLLDWLFELHLSDQNFMYEFGCGTGHNLLRAREQFQDLELCGLDWAKSSQELINKIAFDTQDRKLSSHHFDYFNPDNSILLESGSAVFTIASLEQTGEKFVEFIDYLIRNKPSIVVHVEPIGEMLDPNNLLDNLSVRYFQKRGYLKGLKDHLEILQDKGLIEIIQEQRSFVGSFYIDGYSVIAWRPI
jgi:hypothetical protein